MNLGLGLRLVIGSEFRLGFGLFYFGFFSLYNYELCLLHNVIVMHKEAGTSDVNVSHCFIK